MPDIGNDNFISIVEVGPGMRGKIEKAVEALLELLNGLDDPDLEDDDREPDGGDEESLGHWDATPPANGSDADLELDTADDEPVLGSMGSYSTERPQTEWARGPYDTRNAPDECEQENEHGSDDDAGEPTFGLPFLAGAGRTCRNALLDWNRRSDDRARRRCPGHQIRASGWHSRVSDCG